MSKNEPLKTQHGLDISRVMNIFNKVILGNYYPNNKDVRGEIINSRSINYLKDLFANYKGIDITKGKFIIVAANKAPYWNILVFETKGEIVELSLRDAIRYRYEYDIKHKMDISLDEEEMFDLNNVKSYDRNGLPIIG